MHTRLFLALGLLLASSSLFAQSPSLQDVAGGIAPRPGPTTIFLAREILTMDPRKPKVEAVAVRDGRFVAVGTRAEVEAAAGKDAKLDRAFADKVVMPGFVEPQVNIVLAALTMNAKVISIDDWDTLEGFSPAVRDEKPYQERLKKALAAHTDKSKPFTTWGYHHSFHGEMSRTLLDRSAPDFPVILWHRSCHEFYLNSLALKQVGIDAAFVATLPRSAQAQLSLTKGHFYEQGALAILGKLAPLIASPDHFRAGLEYTVQYAHRNGITVACEPGGFFAKPMQDAINAVSSEAMPFDHSFMADGKTFAARNPKDAKALIADTEQVLTRGKGRTAYLNKQVKLHTDGHKGEWIMDPPAFGHAFQSYWDAGYQIHVHNNGDAGMDVLLANLDKAMKRKPRKDHRTVLVHFGFATPKQVARAAELGAIVSANPYYVTALAGRYSKLGIGPERAKDMVPLGDVVKHKMPLAFHSDMPMAPAKPLQLVWAAVTRLTAEGEVVGPAHKVSLDIALKAITLDAAFSIQKEKEIGSIAVGKRANLTVLEKSPYEVKPEAIKDIVVWGTMLDGRVQPVKSATRPKLDRDAALKGWDTRRHHAQPAGATVSNALGLDTDTSRRIVPPPSCRPGCTCSFAQVIANKMQEQMRFGIDRKPGPKK